MGKLKIQKKMTSGHFGHPNRMALSKLQLKPYQAWWRFLYRKPTVIEIQIRRRSGVRRLPLLEGNFLGDAQFGLEFHHQQHVQTGH